MTRASQNARRVQLSQALPPSVKRARGAKVQAPGQESDPVVLTTSAAELVGMAARCISLVASGPGLSDGLAEALRRDVVDLEVFARHLEERRGRVDLEVGKW